jgi:hypothetical protein
MTAREGFFWIAIRIVFPLIARAKVHYEIYP